MSDSNLSSGFQSLLNKVDSHQEKTSVDSTSEGRSPSPDIVSSAPEDSIHNFQETFVEPRMTEETDIPEPFLADLALKTLYFGGAMRGGSIAQSLHLHFTGVVEPILRILKSQHLVEVTGGSSLNSASYVYTITNKGGERARELLARNRYVGACPVSLQHYVKAVKIQAQRHNLVFDADITAAMQGLILAEEVLERIGPAVNSRESIFIYGPPGNGKTSIAKGIGRHLLPDTVMVPYAIFDDGQIIKMFDPEIHHPIEKIKDQPSEFGQLDQRWVRCTPPVVITGGELTLPDLDLAWSDTNRYYEAPLQLKANGGILVIDDFGRQQMKPSDLLNRWIVPLEERVDYLTFHTGKKSLIPFETLLVFSTNLEPKSLVDEAFLRRITHKLRVDDPTEDQYRKIFTDVCQTQKVEFDENVFNYVLKKYYHDADRPMRACHPRDLVKQLVTFATYRGEPLTMTPKLMDLAASSYFEFL